MNSVRHFLLVCGVVYLGWCSPSWGQASSKVNMNFEQADIGQLVKIVSEATGERFVVSESIAMTFQPEYNGWARAWLAVPTTNFSLMDFPSPRA